MQKFYDVYAYYKDVKVCDLTYGETWVKSYKEALSRIKVPAGGKLDQAWLIEWARPRLTMEPLVYRQPENPDEEIMNFVTRLREKIMGKAPPPATSTASAVVETPKGKKPIVTSKKPYKPYEFYTACSVRDFNKAA